MNGTHHLFRKVQVMKPDLSRFRRDGEFRGIPGSFVPAGLRGGFRRPRLPRRTLGARRTVRTIRTLGAGRTLRAIGTLGTGRTFRTIGTLGARRTFRAIGTLGTGRTFRTPRTVGTIRTGGPPVAAIPLARWGNRTLCPPFAGKTGTLGDRYDRRDGGSSPRAGHLLEQIPEFLQDECCH
jgi:hypothetical protein